MKKILFIEDETSLQKAFGTILKDKGYEVISAFDGESGLKMAEENKPDLILLDLILPKKDGFKILEELRAKQNISAIPVIVLSNLEDKKDIQRCLDLGVHSYLAKANYSLDEVAQKVDELFKGVFK